MMFALLNDEHEAVSKKAVDVVIELYRRKVAHSSVVRPSDLMSHIDCLLRFGLMREQ